MKPILSKISRTMVHLWKAPSLFSPTRVGVDLGTSMTRIALEEKGVILREPTYVGMNVRTGQALFLGDEAKQIYGKAPEYIKVMKPIEHSIISDFDGTVSLMQDFLKKAVYPYYHAHLVRKGLAAYTAVPSSATEVEQKATREALLKAGFQSAYLLDRTVMSAIGAGCHVFTNKPVFIVDMGAGSIEASIIIMGGIVKARVMKFGGDHMDKLIYNYLHLKYGLVIGELTAEQLKNELYSLRDTKAMKTIRGKSLENGLPKSVKVTSADIREALSVPLNHMVDGMKELIETSPPEVIDGLIRSGAVLTGHLASVPGIDTFMSQEVKIPVAVSKNPEDAVIYGLFSLLKEDEQLKRIVIHS